MLVGRLALARFGEAQPVTKGPAENSRSANGWRQLVRASADRMRACVSEARNAH
jgi:hypothetical protein